MMTLILALALSQSLNLNDRAQVVKTAPDSTSIGVFGIPKVAEETPLENITFQYTINDQLVRTTVSDGGTITNANSSAVMTTGTLDGGYAEVSSKRLTRYVPGQGIKLRFTAVFAACTAQSTQEVGLGNGAGDFLGVGCVGATFGAIHRKAGSQTFVAKASWNGSPITFDHTKGNVYSVAYQWLGYGVMRVQMERPNGEFVTVHTFQFPNSRTTPTFANPALRFIARAYNWGNTSSLALAVPSVGIVTEGNQSNGGVHRGRLSRRSVTTSPVPVFTLQNAAAWDGGIENMMVVRIQDIHLSGTGAGDINCEMREDAQLNSPTWVEVGPNSPVWYDVTGGQVDGGTIRHAWVFEGSAGGAEEDFGTIHIEPGQTLAVQCYSVTGTSTVGVAVNWSEDF